MCFLHIVLGPKKGKININISIKNVIATISKWSIFSLLLHLLQFITRKFCYSPLPGSFATVQHQKVLLQFITRKFCYSSLSGSFVTVHHQKVLLQSITRKFCCSSTPESFAAVHHQKVLLQFITRKFCYNSSPESFVSKVSSMSKFQNILTRQKLPSLS